MKKETLKTFRFCVIILAQWIISATGFAQDQTPSEKLIYKNARVKTKNVIEFNCRHNKPRGRGKLLFKQNFDSAGNEIESWSYVVDEFHQIFVYNNRGDLTESTGFVLGHAVTDYYICSYNSTGQIIEKRKADSGEKWQYSYDSLGRMVSTRWQHYGFEITGSCFVDSFYYDGNNRSRYVRFHSNSKEYFRFYYTYDFAGNRIKEYRVEKGDTTDIWINEYDSAGRLIFNKVTGKSGDEVISWYNVDYLPNGLTNYITGKLSFEKKEYFRIYQYTYYE